MRALAALAAFVLALGLAEGFVRLVAGRPADFLFTGGFRDTQAGWDITYTVDARGGRVTDAATGPAVAVIGDSFVFGQGVRDHADFVSLLNRAALGRRFENLGMVGAGLNEYAIVARDRVGPGHGGALLLLSSNDVGHAVPGRSIGARLAAASSCAALLQKAWRAALVARERRRGSGASNVDALLLRDPRYFLDNVQVEPANGAAFARDADLVLERLAARVPREHIVLALAPDATLVAPAFRQYVERRGGVTAPAGREGADAALVREAARRNGVRYLDLFPVFAACGSPCYHAADLHWTEEGHRRAARAVEAALSGPPTSRATW